MFRRQRSLASVLVAVVALLLTASPALAECTGQDNRVPSFTEVAPTAKRIIVATVISVPPGARWASTFTVRVDEVLRGSSPDTVEIVALGTGLPRVGAPACQASATFKGKRGQVVAFAFGGRLAEYPGQSITTAAWIEGKPPGMSMRDIELLTLDEVRAIAALPQTATAGPESAAQGSALLLLGSVLGIAAAAGLGRRRRSLAVMDPR